MTPKTIIIPADLYERVAQEAQGEGKTVDEVATEAVKRELARRWLDRTRQSHGGGHDRYPHPEGARPHGRRREGGARTALDDGLVKD
jgi:hypothetical protein